MKNINLKLSISALGVALNIILAIIVKSLSIPFLFMDTVGTIFSAVILGPFYGAITGLITNIITSLVNNPKELPFAIVNIAIGITVGLIAKKFEFSIKTSIITGIFLAILAPIIGTPIAVYLFDGLVGGTLDIFVGILSKTGANIFTATFLPRIAENLIDKILSCVFVALIIKKIPNNILREIKDN